MSRVVPDPVSQLSSCLYVHFQQKITLPTPCGMAKPLAAPGERVFAVAASGVLGSHAATNRRSGMSRAGRCGGCGMLRLRMGGT
jgi:hypothetical protein